MKKTLSLILLSLLSLMILAGCGGGNYDKQARDRAQSYIKEKYGFTADIVKVSVSENSWLEFTWEAPEFARVRMKHDGKEFDVLVSIRENIPSVSCDNYESDKICADIENYVRTQLGCDDIAFRIDYGNNYGRNMLPKDIRSAEDLKKSDKTKSISVYTRGLDLKNVDRLDPAAYGEQTRFGIVVWEGGTLPEVPYGTITSLPQNCGWLVSSIHFTDNGGNWTHMEFDRIVKDNICLVMPKECEMTMEKTDGPGAPDDVPVTDWYSIKGNSDKEGSGVLYITAGAKRDDEYCIEYVHDGKAYYERLPHTGSEEKADYELCAHMYYGGDGYNYVFRTVKRDFYKDMKD